MRYILTLRTRGGAVRAVHTFVAVTWTAILRRAADHLANKGAPVDATNFTLAPSTLNETEIDRDVGTRIDRERAEKLLPLGDDPFYDPLTVLLDVQALINNRLPNVLRQRLARLIDETRDKEAHHAPGGGVKSANTSSLTG